MAVIAAGEAAIFHVGIAETSLERDDLGEDERTHADRIGGDDVLEHHAFRAGEAAAAVGQEGADGIGIQFFVKGDGIGSGEQVGQSAGEEAGDSVLAAEFNAIGDVGEGGIGGELRVKFISGAAEGIGVITIDADINIDAVNLVKLVDGIFVILDDGIALRQDAEDVLLQINARRDGDTNHGDDHGGQQDQPPVRGQPQVQGQIKFGFHLRRNNRART